MTISVFEKETHPERGGSLLCAFESKYHIKILDKKSGNCYVIDVLKIGWQLVLIQDTQTDRQYYLY